MFYWTYVIVLMSHYSCELLFGHYYVRIASSVYGMLALCSVLAGGCVFKFFLIILPVLVNFPLCVYVVSALVLGSIFVYDCALYPLTITSVLSSGRLRLLWYRFLFLLISSYTIVAGVVFLCRCWCGAN